MANIASQILRGDTYKAPTPDQPRAQDLSNRGMSLADFTKEIFGMDPAADRMPLFPHFARDKKTGYPTLIAPEWLHSAAKSVSSARHVMKGGNITTEEMVNIPLDMMVGAAALSGAKTGALGMFVGRSAKGGNRANLTKAIVMTRKGHTPDDIWVETGYGKQHDGQWRWEVDDSGSIYMPEKHAAVGEWQPLRDIFTHTELNEAYPGAPIHEVAGDLANRALLDTPIMLVPKREMGNSFASYSDNEGIRLSTEALTNPEAAKRAIVHELQHAIQNIENFAYGGTPSKFSTQNFITEYLKKNIDSPVFMKAVEVAARKKFNVEFNELNRMHQRGLLREIAEVNLPDSVQQDQWRAYWLNLGEAEARLSEQRLDYDPTSSDYTI